MCQELGRRSVSEHFAESWHIFAEHEFGVSKNLRLVSLLIARQEKVGLRDQETFEEEESKWEK